MYLIFPRVWKARLRRSGRAQATCPSISPPERANRDRKAVRRTQPLAIPKVIAGLHLATKFTISLLEMTMSKQPVDIRAARTTILFVEDEPLIRMDMAEFLRECGYRVHEASTAVEAIEAL